MFDFIKKIFKSFLLVELIHGLRVTWKHFLGRKVTIYYPEEVIPKSARFRGLHALMRYDNGEEKCIGCKLCEVICPARAITIETDVRDDGSRRTTRYDIDLFKCIFCGFCEEACPVDSIVETSIVNYHFYNREDSIMTKEKLLAIGDKFRDDILKMKEKDSYYR